MRHIILSTQHVLQQIQDRQIADASMFEPDIELTAGDKDRWYATPHIAYIFNTMLPKLILLWEAEQEQQQNEGINNTTTTTTASSSLTSFEFSEREVMWAFSNYSDAVGPVLRRQKTMYVL